MDRDRLLLSMTLLPQVMPFEAAQVFLAGFGPVLVEQFENARHIAALPGVVNKVRVRGVEIAVGGF